MSQFDPNTPPEPFKPPLPAEQLPSGGKGLAVSSLALSICGFIPFLAYIISLVPMPEIKLPSYLDSIPEPAFFRYLGFLGCYFTCFIYLTPMVGIILGIVSLVKRRAGAGLATAGIALGFAMYFICTVISILPPRTDPLGSPYCPSNLHTIGSAIERYVADKDGKFPPDLRTLVWRSYLSSLSIRYPYTEPARDKKIRTDYFYMPPLSTDANPKKILACDLKPNHKGEQRGWRNVLYFDYSVKFISGEDFRSELKLPCNSAFAKALRKKERLPGTQPSN